MLVYSQDTKSHFKRDPFCFREHTIEIIRIKCNYAQIWLWSSSIILRNIIIRGVEYVYSIMYSKSENKHLITES